MKTLAQPLTPQEFERWMEVLEVIFDRLENNYMDFTLDEIRKVYYSGQI